MNNWQVLTVADLVDQNLIFPPMDGNHGEIHPKSDDVVDDGIPFVMASDLSDQGNIDLLGCKFISQEQAESLRNGFAREGDVLLSHKATIGRTAIVPEISFPYLMLTPQVTYYRVRDTEQIDNRFLRYAFQSPQFQKTLALWSDAGSTRAYIGITKQRGLKVRLPDVRCQRDIADVLSALDAKITLNNKINAELEAMSKLIYDYWFIQFDFPDEDGKPYKSSGGKMVWCDLLKREIPKGWATSDVASVTESIKRGISPDYTEEEGLRVINQRCIRNQSINFSAARIHKGSMGADDARIVKQWDVLVNSTGVGTLGRVAHVKAPTSASYVTDSHVTTLRADESKIARPYFAYSLKRLQPVIEAAANGSTGQVELSRPYLEGIKFVVPDGDLQKDFGALVSQISEKQSLAETENQELASLRDWLLPMLMNGQVSISG